MSDPSIGRAAETAPSVVESGGGVHTDRFLDTSSDELAQSWASLLELQVTCLADGEIAFLGNLPGFVRARRILDVGCGQGSFTAALSSAFPGKRYTGIDVSERLIARAAARWPAIDFRVADLVEFRPTARFDAVVMRFVLQHMPDLGLILTCCRRLLRPGGALIVIEPSLSESRNWPPTPRFMELLAGFEARRDEHGFLKARTAGLAGDINQVRGWTASTELIPVRTSGPDLERVSALYERWISMIEASAADLVGGHAVRGELADWRTSAGATSHIALSATVAIPV